jgi:hypothetical protein
MVHYLMSYRLLMQLETLSEVLATPHMHQYNFCMYCIVQGKVTDMYMYMSAMHVWGLPFHMQCGAAGSSIVGSACCAWEAGWRAQSCMYVSARH